MGAKYVSYNYFRVFNHYVKPPEYYLDSSLLNRLINLQAELEEKEQQKYYRMRLKSDSNINLNKIKQVRNWKAQLKNYLGQEYKTYNEEQAFKGLRSALNIIVGDIEPYNSKAEKADMQQRFVNKLAEDLQLMYSEMNLSLFPQNDYVQDVGEKIFKDLYKKYKNNGVQITETGIRFRRTNGKSPRYLIGGNLFEMFNGLTGKNATATTDKQLQKDKEASFLPDVADFFIEGVGLEEIKRSTLLDDTNQKTNILKDINFGFGSFTSKGAIDKEKNQEKMAQHLAKLTTSFLRDENMNKMSEEQIREVLLNSFTELVIDYLEWRLKSMPTSIGTQENGGNDGDIFWIVSRYGVILGSEFIEGLIKYHKLYIGGYAHFMGEDTKIDYRTEGFRYLIELLGYVAGDGEMPITSEERSIIKEMINRESHTAGHTFIKELKFNVNYGNYRKQ